MKLLFVSLGCDKNLVDTEHMLSRLVKHDFVLTDDENEASYELGKKLAQACKEL